MNGRQRVNEETVIGAAYREKVSRGIMDARMQRCGSEEEKIVELYRQGFAHSDIANRGWDLETVRRVIGGATAADEALYQRHCEGRSNK